MDLRGIKKKKRGGGHVLSSPHLTITYNHRRVAPPLFTPLFFLRLTNTRLTVVAAAEQQPSSRHWRVKCTETPSTSSSLFCVLFLSMLLPLISSFVATCVVCGSAWRLFTLFIRPRPCRSLCATTTTNISFVLLPSLVRRATTN